jgi:hypothetical protein
MQRIVLHKALPYVKLIIQANEGNRHLDENLCPDQQRMKYKIHGFNIKLRKNYHLVKCSSKKYT